MKVLQINFICPKNSPYWAVFALVRTRGDMLKNDMFSRIAIEIYLYTVSLKKRKQILFVFLSVYGTIIPMMLGRIYKFLPAFYICLLPMVAKAEVYKCLMCKLMLPS